MLSTFYYNACRVGRREGHHPALALTLYRRSGISEVGEAIVALGPVAGDPVVRKALREASRNRQAVVR